MSKLFDTSVIPDTPEYWESLARRVSAASRQPRSGLDWVARSRQALIAVASLVAIAAGFVDIILPAARANNETFPRTRDEWAAALGPRDSGLARIETVDTPPSLTDLVLGELNASSSKSTNSERRP